MSRTQRQFMAANMGDENDYVVHLEDALMRACVRLADSPQAYEECNTDIGWFRHLILSSSIHPKTGESPLLKGKYEKNLFVDKEDKDVCPISIPDLSGIREVYEKYEHLDNALSDHSMVDDYRGQMLYTFWQVIKDVCKEEQ